MRALISALTLTIVCGFASANAMEVKDVVKLSKLKLEDEVIMAQIKAKKARFTLTTEQIVQLKKDGVSNRLIKYMIETGSASKPAGREAAEEAPATKTEAPAEKKIEEAAKQPEKIEKQPADGLGTLVLENLDDQPYSIQFDAKNGRIFFWRGTDAAGRSPVPANTSLVYRVAPRSYMLRWVGEIAAYSVTVTAGKKSRAVLTRTTTDGTETVKLNTYEDGVRRGGGKLVTLAEASPAESKPIALPATTAATEKHYYYATPQPATTTTYVVERPRSHCYSNYCSRGQYHPGCRFHRYYRYRRTCSPNIGFVYGWKRGKSRYAVGLSSSGAVGFSYGRKVGRGRYAIGIGW